jgi:hypothetical protein
MVSIRLQGREGRQDYVNKLNAETLRVIDEYPVLEPKQEEHPRKGR